jgi:hypothetical protein
MTKKRTLIILLFCVLLLIPIGLLFSTPGRLLLLDWNQAQWQRQHIRHYRYTFKNVSFANANNIYDVVIEVKDGQTVSLSKKSDGAPVAMAIFHDYSTIPKIFQRLHTIIEQAPFMCVVRYQFQTGIPVSADIDFSPRTTDDEYSLTLTDFEVLSEPEQ